MHWAEPINQQPLSARIVTLQRTFWSELDRVFIAHASRLRKTLIVMSRVSEIIHEQGKTVLSGIVILYVTRVIRMSYITT